MAVFFLFQIFENRRSSFGFTHMMICGQPWVKQLLNTFYLSTFQGALGGNSIFTYSASKGLFIKLHLRNVLYAIVKLSLVYLYVWHFMATIYYNYCYKRHLRVYIYLSKHIQLNVSNNEVNPETKVTPQLLVKCTLMHGEYSLPTTLIRNNILFHIIHIQQQLANYTIILMMLNIPIYFDIKFTHHNLYQEGENAANGI